ncbi:MAG TPA: hypothetical protein VEB22_14520, partial [Phycisphaerales bacterium]|nr:hypothetical protein [Phycisphaerales bacterium]
VVLSEYGARRFSNAPSFVGVFPGSRFGVWSFEQSAFQTWETPARNGTTTTIHVVLWPIPLLLWTPGALLLRSGILARRRAMKGMCATCGYSLAGLSAGAACPECGKPSSTLIAQDSSLKTSS